jgi:putative transcriptional regulator
MSLYDKMPQDPAYLDGQMLIAMPSMQDERFARTVIYLCAHSADGAMGIVINQPVRSLRFPELLVQLDIIGAAETGRLPPPVEDLRVLCGGPVESARGFVLHSADFFSQDATLPVGEDICLTATLDILRAMAGGTGPRNALLALGYAGWAPGQLESEIQANGWLHCAADGDILFAPETETKYERALGKLGVDPAMLSTNAGHA